MAAEKVCIIGAGRSGIAAQVLKARGIPYYCLKKGSFIGGNWRYENDNGMSSAYHSLHINTSRRVMAFRTLPMPDHFPTTRATSRSPSTSTNTPTTSGCGRRFASHRGRRGRAGGRGVGDDVEAGGERETNRYRAVLVANGHPWASAEAGGRLALACFGGCDRHRGTGAGARGAPTDQARALLGALVDRWNRLAGEG